MQAVNNVSSNTLLEYFMLTTIFETLVQVWFIPSIGFNSNYYHTNAKIIEKYWDTCQKWIGNCLQAFL